MEKYIALLIVTSALAYILLRSNSMASELTPYETSEVQPPDESIRLQPSAERTTARLVGNGLVYFVFWFFGAPMLFVLLFLVSQGSEVPEIFFAGIIVGIFGFMAHTIWIIADGFEASTSTDKPATPSKMVDAQPSQSNRIPCPMCAELILPEAKICRFCKSEIRKD